MDAAPKNLIFQLKGQRFEDLMLQDDTLKLRIDGRNERLAKAVEELAQTHPEEKGSSAFDEKDTPLSSSSLDVQQLPKEEPRASAADAKRPFLDDPEDELKPGATKKQRLRLMRKVVEPTPEDIVSCANRLAAT